MFNRLYVYVQYLLPQHWLSCLIGMFADARLPWIKNFLIKCFLYRYNVNLIEAEIEDPYAYPTFNDFFIRRLKTNARPIDVNEKKIVSPADGTIAQLGTITQNRLFQAKHFYLDLNSLLAGDEELTQNFTEGSFLTLYLAPRNYHRVHMPIAGSLLKTIFVPGRLFSVNSSTADYIPNLYSRNERFISIFDTVAGQMVVILVGAMIVGSIKTVWMQQPVRQPLITRETPAKKLFLKKGDELGLFKMGSTVIVLFQKDRIVWDKVLRANRSIEFGQAVGNIIRPKIQSI